MVKYRSSPSQRPSASTLPLVRSEVAKEALDFSLGKLIELSARASGVLASTASNESDYLSANKRAVDFIIYFSARANVLSEKIPSSDGPNMQILVLSINTLFNEVDSKNLLSFTDHRARGDVRVSSLKKRISDTSLMIEAVIIVAEQLFTSFGVEFSSSHY